MSPICRDIVTLSYLDQLRVVCCELSAKPPVAQDPAKTLTCIASAARNQQAVPKFKRKIWCLQTVKI